MFFKDDKSGSSCIPAFIKANFPNLIHSSATIDQLDWLQGNSVCTSQSNVQAQASYVNFEVKRALTRLNAYYLLLSSNQEAYVEFIQSQPEESKLGKENFFRLSELVNKLSSEAKECLRATCLITKSDMAVSKLQEKHIESPADSEQFISHSVTYCPEIYPVCSKMSQGSIALLQWAFYRNSHVRHMLDVEGGYNMFGNIVQAIRLKDITYEQYELWMARWIINLAGLDGHLNHKGSVYLTQPVAECFFTLKAELDTLWDNPLQPVLDNYLEFRKKQLGVNTIYTAYLGALMRQYTPKTGAQIQAWFDSLAVAEQEEKIQTFKKQLEQTQITPTYKPTVLLNLLALGCTVAEALTIFTKIESYAFEIYTSAISDEKVSPETPLSFREIAFKENLLLIKGYYDSQKKLPTISISANGSLEFSVAATHSSNYSQRM